MTIREILTFNEQFTYDGNKFELWPPCNYHAETVLSLTSKFGFRRFFVPVDMELKDAQIKAIEIDAALCAIPRPEWVKKYIGHHFIQL